MWKKIILKRIQENLIIAISKNNIPEIKSLKKSIHNVKQAIKWINIVIENILKQTHEHQ